MAAPRNIDWSALEKDYVTGNITYHDLAANNGIHYRTLEKVAIENGWRKKRNIYRQKVLDKSVKAAEEKEIEQNTAYLTITNELLHKIEDAVKELDVSSVKAFKDITGALKDIKEIRGDKDKLDIEEQIARIAKLKHDVEQRMEGETTINIVGVPKEYLE